MAINFHHITNNFITFCSLFAQIKSKIKNNVKKRERNLNLFAFDTHDKSNFLIYSFLFYSQTMTTATLFSRQQCQWMLHTHKNEKEIRFVGGKFSSFCSSNDFLFAAIAGNG
jgi:hypothetical protein